MSQEDYRAAIRELSDRLVVAQKPIRILDAIKWDDSIQEAFFARDCREPPPVDAAYYQSRPLGFEVSARRDMLAQLERDVVARLGQFDGAGRILRRMCGEYQNVLRMLEQRGKPEFSQISQELYGRASDPFHAGGPTLVDLSELMDRSLRNIDENMFLERDVRDIPTSRAVELLQERLDRVFSDPDARVLVRESDGIVADAAAGSDYIKLRKGAMFGERELRALEAHEGWVHVATTLNGRSQPVCTFLGKGTPSTTITQEGLALLVEVISFNSHPARLRRITDRMRAVQIAENGGSFLDVFEKLCEDGRPREEAYAVAVRVFRGSTPDGGPFTKDLAYAKGFVLIYNFIRLAVRRGRLNRIPLLFCGKVALEDMGTLAGLADEGIVEPPRYLPPPLRDLNALTAWMAFSNFLNQLDLSRIEVDFAPLLLSL